jgi:hypothetical protein
MGHPKRAETIKPIPITGKIRSQSKLSGRICPSNKIPASITPPARKAPETPNSIHDCNGSCTRVRKASIILEIAPLAFQTMSAKAITLTTMFTASKRLSPATYSQRVAPVRPMIGDNTNAKMTAATKVMTFSGFRNVLLNLLGSR